MPKDVHALGLLFQQHAVTVPRTEKYLKMKNEPSTETAEGNLHIREWTTKIMICIYIELFIMRARLWSDCLAGSHIETGCLALMSLLANL